MALPPGFDLYVESMAIHATAIVNPGVTLGNDVEIGPFCILESGVVIGDGTVLESHVVVHKGVRMGAGCRVHPFCVIGDLPQYIGFDAGISSGVTIGDGTTLREGVTIHRSIYPDQSTVVGAKNYLMANSHVAHDCVLEDNVVLTNGVLLAGHVHVATRAYIGGAAALHQFVRVGEGAVVGGMSTITQDIAPFLMVTGRDEVNGLNLVGLKRRGLSREVIKDLKACFHALFDVPGNIRQQAALLRESGSMGRTPEAQIFLSFFEGGKRGFAGLKRRNRGSGVSAEGDTE